MLRSRSRYFGSAPVPFFWQVKNEMIYRSSLFIVYCIIISTGTVPVGTCSIYLQLNMKQEKNVETEYGISIFCKLSQFL